MKMMNYILVKDTGEIQSSGWTTLDPSLQERNGLTAKVTDFRVSELLYYYDTGSEEVAEKSDCSSPTISTDSVGWTNLPSGSYVTVKDNETGVTLDTIEESGGSILVEFVDPGSYRILLEPPFQYKQQKVGFEL